MSTVTSDVVLQAIERGQDRYQSQYATEAQPVRANSLTDVWVAIAASGFVLIATTFTGILAVILASRIFDAPTGMNAFVACLFGASIASIITFWRVFDFTLHTAEVVHEYPLDSDHIDIVSEQYDQILNRLDTMARSTAKPQEVVIQVDERKENGRWSLIRLPADIEAKMEDVSIAVIRKGSAFSRRGLEDILTRTQFEKLRDAMIERQWASLTNTKPQRVQLLGAGRKMLRHYLP